MSEEKKPPQRDNNFNFLRLLFALCVIFSHSFELRTGWHSDEPLVRVFGTLTFGGVAVTGFFLLSGYLIVQSWTHAPSLIVFLKKRIARIYPGFVTASLISVFIVGAIGGRHDYLAQLDVKTVVSDLLLLQMPQTPPVFDGSSHQLVNGSLWTISYEFRCYLLVALLGICGLLASRYLWLALTLLAVSITLIGAVQPAGVLDGIRFPSSTYLIGSLSHFAALSACFGAGGCFYLYRDRIRFRMHYALIGLIVAIAGLYALPTAYLSIISLGGYALFTFAFAPIKCLNRFKSAPDISYGVYLYGWPLQKLLLYYFPTLSVLSLCVAASALSSICGLASWHYVEKRFLAHRQRPIISSETTSALNTRLATEPVA